MVNCNNSGNLARRISFEASLAIFEATSEVAYVGSAICTHHKKEFIGPASLPQTSVTTFMTSLEQELTSESQDKHLAQPIASGNFVSQEVVQSEYVLSALSYPSSKRRAFSSATESFPKVLKSDSERSDSVSCSQPDSQVSNASANSDIIRSKELSKFEVLTSCLQDIDPTLNIANQFDLTVHDRSLKTYADTVGHVWKLIVEVLTNQSFNDAATCKFVKLVIESVQPTPGDEKQNVSLALNILQSLSDYYRLACQDRSLSSTATKKQILLASTGRSVRSANQLSALSASLGARKNTVFSLAAKRYVLEDKGSILPYLQVLERKSPHG